MIHYTYAFIYTSVHVFQQMRRYEYSVDQRETYLSVAEAESKFFLSSFCSKKKKNASASDYRSKCQRSATCDYHGNRSDGVRIILRVCFSSMLMYDNHSDDHNHFAGCPLLQFTTISVHRPSRSTLKYFRR